MGAGSADRYVVGGVNWESYTLEALIAMVADNASPPQLEQLADDWRQAGNEVNDAAAVLELALAQLMQFWSGTAAEQARQDVSANARWLGDLGETAHQIGDPIQEAAGALKAAQDAMPALPAPTATPPARSAEGADTALDTGGPLAAAISGTATGAESAFAAEQEQTRLKTVAVEAMRRFEGAAIGIDEATPAFTAQSTGGPTLPPAPHVRTPGEITHPPTTLPPTDAKRWNDLTNNGTTASGSTDTPRTPAAAPTGTPFGGGGYAGGATGLTEGNVGAHGRPLQPGPAVGLTDTFNPNNRPAPATPLAATAGGTGTAAGGMPMGAGMGAGAGTGGDAAEHRRRYPYDAENPFANDQKASPPVIGL